MPDVSWTDIAKTTSFHSPGRLLMGRGAVKEMAPLLRNRLRVTDDASVLLLTDFIVRDLPAFADLQQSLKEAGYEVSVAAVSGPEPDHTEIDALVQQARDVRAGVTIGVGGGSVLDTAKFVAALATNAGRSTDALGPVEWSQPRTPLILVPTTCGTGSEVTPYAMVTVDGHKRASACPDYLPDAAVLDPALLDSLPPTAVAATGMDALAHATESLLSTLRSPMTDQFAVAAINLILTWLERATESDQTARANMLFASHLAGMSLNAGVVLGHSLAYCLAHAAPNGMPHGMSCALALPYCLAYNRAIEPERTSLVAECLTGDPEAGLLDAASVVRDLTQRLGLPVTLTAVDIPDTAYDEIAKSCVTDYPRPGNPVPMEFGPVRALLPAMRDGDLIAAFGGSR